jgi:type IV secretory pathway VirJ component
MPFVLAALPQDLQRRIGSVSLLGLSTTATFEVKVSDWIGGGRDGLPVAPQIASLENPPPMLCVYGEDEKDSPCPRLAAGVAREAVGHGHHFSGDYEAIAQRVLAFDGRAAGSGTR